MKRCYICSRLLKNIKSLTNHIRNTHKTTIREYYDTFLKRKYEEYCNGICINEIENRPNFVRFRSMEIGYNKYCSTKCKPPKTKYIKLLIYSNLCDYGCGELAKYQNPNNKKYCCSNRWERCSNSRSNTSNRFIGINRVPKGIKINNKKVLCNYGCGELAKYQFPGNKKYCCSSNPSSCKKRRDHISKCITNLYKDPKFLERLRLGTNISPNKPEKILLNLLTILYPNKYKFTGDRKFWIGGKNPDFVNEKERRIIEHFGDWYHGEEMTNNSKKEEEQQRVNHFKKYKYDTLVIWESELKNIDKVIKRINLFERRINGFS